jgi:hypothetical protein
MPEACRIRGCHAAHGADGEPQALLWGAAASARAFRICRRSHVRGSPLLLVSSEGRRCHLKVKSNEIGLEKFG